MEFIGGNSTRKCLAEFLKSETDEIALAVAFWGGDAMARLDIEKWEAPNIRIICNATSGPCNPKALEFLMKRFGPRLKTNPKLHAKVYWTPRKMLVTSANASASGFALAGKEDEANIEAGIAITSPEMIKAVKDWFDALYQSPKSARVDKKIIEIAKQKWAIRPPNLPIDGDLSLTEALRDKELIADRNIWVGNFDSGERSPEGLQQHYKLQRDWKTSIRPSRLARTLNSR